ncbi:MAG: TQO small subunit DoxD [Rubripirellula sp.]
MRNLLLFPLRLLIGWGLSPRLLGLIAATMLVLLRISIGWHFYCEGVDKRDAGNWSAAPFFANAKGPFAEHFRKMVWDSEGQLRLNKENTQAILKDYQGKAAAHYGFDENQIKLADASLKSSMEQYDWVIETNAADLEEYRLGRERVRMLETDEHEKAVRDGVSSLGGQRSTIRREWQGKGAAAMKQVSGVWSGFESSINEIASEDQRASRGRFRLDKPRTFNVDTSVMDQWIPYFDIAVGLCLLLGLFTPLAALAAAGFLFSVFLSQYPPTTGPSSSMYQLIESMACFVLAATGAGRFAGLDFFLHLLVRKNASAQPETT